MKTNKKQDNITNKLLGKTVYARHLLVFKAVH